MREIYKKMIKFFITEFFKIFKIESRRLLSVLRCKITNPCPVSWFELFLRVHLLKYRSGKTLQSYFKYVQVSPQYFLLKVYINSGSLYTGERGILRAFVGYWIQDLRWQEYQRCKNANFAPIRVLQNGDHESYGPNTYKYLTEGPWGLRSILCSFH